KSSQDTAPTAGCAGYPLRKKTKKSALREGLSLDKKMPHKCWAALLKTHEGTQRLKRTHPCRRFARDTDAAPVAPSTDRDVPAIGGAPSSAPAIPTGSPR